MTTLQHTEAITRMDPLIYKAAAQGNLEAISDPLDGFLTVNKNTILHICISSILIEETFPATGGTDPTSAAKFVKDVLDKCPSLLLKPNAEDDTPLHVAARYGHASIVKVLIEHQKYQHKDLENGVIEATKMMIGKLNKEKDTALHEAVRHNHIEVVKQLLMEVDPEFLFGANDAGETPLYLAAERHFPDLVSEILNKLNSTAYDGPLGRTALHAAAFYNDKGMFQNILERCGPDLCKQADQNKWTPLHMAAYMGSIEPAKQLLEYSDGEVAYMKDTEGRTALHIAAHRNWSGVMEVIISMYPDCCEMVDNEGRNALHLAVNNWWPDAALIIQDNSSLRNLLNQKDNNGNTPLHQYYSNSSGYGERVLNSPRVDKLVFNKKNQSACQILTSKSLDFPTFNDKNKMRTLEDWENLNFCVNGRVFEVGHDEINKKKPNEVEKEKSRDKKIEEEDKVAQAHLVVAALITTVTFAAGITMPGGFVGGDNNTDSGSAVLRKSAAFKAFVITNALSLMLSSSAVFIHLFIPLIPSTEYFFEKRISFLRIAFWFLLSSMAPMVLAFVTDSGSAVSKKSAAFKAFVITNALWLMLSSSAVFIHLVIPFILSEGFCGEKRIRLLQIAFRFLISAMVPMILAFVRGTYAVLAHSNIAIPTCIICVSFFPMFSYIFRKM